MNCSLNKKPWVPGSITLPMSDLSALSSSIHQRCCFSGSKTAPLRIISSSRNDRSKSSLTLTPLNREKKIFSRSSSRIYFHLTAQVVSRMPAPRRECGKGKTDGRDDWEIGRSHWNVAWAHGSPTASALVTEEKAIHVLDRRLTVSLREDMKLKCSVCGEKTTT